MRQFTTKEQTQHLIELGFPKPNSVINEHKILELSPYAPIEFEYAYSVGELIGFLDTVNVRTDIGIGLAKPTCVNTNKGYVCWNWELIDNLYDLCVKLKNEGIINPQTI